MTRLAALRCIVLAAFVTALVATATATASAATVPFVFDGDVDTVVHTGGATYVAGTFTHEYAPTGGGIVTSAGGAGTPRPSALAPVAGSVDVVAGDGAGGWYIAGDFQAVGALQRSRLAHILADGRVDPAWAPDPDGQVTAIAAVGERVYVAGDFGRIGGQRSESMVALDRATGALAAWSAGVDGAVDSIVPAEDTLYLGGGFHVAGGQPRNGLAAVSAVTGAVTAWDPAPEGGGPFSRVAGVVGETVYVWGLFDRIGGRARAGVAALDARTGRVRAWNPAPDAAPDRLVVGERAVYAAGGFSRIGGRPRASLAALDATTGRATPWNPAHRGGLGLLAAGPGRVYAFGRFTSRGHASRYRVTQLSTATGRPTGWDPAPAVVLRKTYKNNEVPRFAVAAAAGKVFLGGEFAAAGPPLAAIGRLARLRADGSLDRSWDPRPTGAACAAAATAPCVAGLAVGDRAIYLGGTFARVGGAARAGLAAVDAVTGRATRWSPRADGPAVPQAIGGGAVLVTGAFAHIGGQARARLAALDLATGSATAWAPNPDGTVDHVAVAGGVAYVAGRFATIGGQARGGLVALDLTTGAPTAWRPAPGVDPHVLATGDAGVYVSQPEAWGGGLAGALTLIDATTGAGVFATPPFGSAVERIALSAGTAYLATGDGLSAVDAATGALLPWSPRPNYQWNEGHGRTDGQNGLAVAGAEVYAAGGFWHTATAVTGPLARLDGTSGATLSTTLTTGR